jgi:hypothetical protein
MHAATRRPVVSWPAALLPAALLLALFAGSAGAGGHVGASSERPPVTELQVTSSP